MKIYFVDSFTSEKFKGNPAAVCFPATELNTEIMQNVATEIGFSETAFVKQITNNIYSIRFFTPKCEISLCGHATLASSKIIFDTNLFDCIKFINNDGVELIIEKIYGKIKMQFPVYDTEEIDVPEKMLKALGINKIVNKRYNTETKIILVEIESAAELKKIQPDFIALVKSYLGVNGVLVTAISDNKDYDFYYRYFWPWIGTNEDPVTGGVQTFLTKYWAEKLNKNKLNAFQCSTRTGIMSTEIIQDKVNILGEAVTIFEGQFKL